MLGNPVKAGADRILGRGVRLLLRGGVRPAGSRILQALVAGGAGVALARGLVAAGTALLALHVLFDWLDGALQRAGATVASPHRAAWTHALADKVSDAAILAGLAAGGLTPLWLCGGALLASLLATSTLFFCVHVVLTTVEPSMIVNVPTGDTVPPGSPVREPPALTMTGDVGERAMFRVRLTPAASVVAFVHHG